MAKIGNKHHVLHSELGPDALIGLLKERAKEVERERKHMERAEQEAFDRIQEEKHELIKILEEEIERNEKAAKLAKAKLDQTAIERARIKRRKVLAKGI